MRLVPCVAILLVLLSGARATGAEKWADPGLKPPAGLLCWLDVGRQAEAHAAHGRPAPAGKLDVCYDASGNGLHFGQRAAAAQPRLSGSGDRRVLRFDGVDDCLLRDGPGRRVEAFTLFVVGAVRSNTGGFRALFAGHESGKNDYTTGFNVDLGWAGSAALDGLNVEGPGFGGMAALLASSHPLGSFHTFTITCRPGAGGVRVRLDGKDEGKRDRSRGTIKLDHLSLAARCYSNTVDPPFLSGFLDGDVAEVLLFDRALADDERTAVETYLMRKHAGLAEALAEDGRVPLKTVADPPPVQMFVPGLVVKQLPVDLTNVNNLRYRKDGKLLALGYDGNVHLLSDTDGDGIEDKADLWWDNKGSLRAPIGMALAPPGSPHGPGVFVAAKGKVVFLAEDARTGRAGREVVVAQGWKELPHGVDALGVAVDETGSVYFGLGVADFTNAYLLKDGKSHFDLKGERGTVLKVSPDFRRREVLATGIRFPVGLAFNARGDLFATDQEGATWLPNGNPFDELLHVRPGRHYGFPPRHPRHLPGVVDEPSVFDYGPQHQSTCGLVFNEPVNGGPVFGPESWKGNALVTGYSRGKLYRTELVRTGRGDYVARTHLLAVLNMLTVDCCVSPKGELVVAVHSGAPDWGSGPTGKGKLYKIVPDLPGAPQPLFAWLAGPQEVRVAFDKALDPESLKDLARQTRIEYGEHVRAGDRFESLRPGYAVVAQQMAAPRFELPVQAAAVSADRRTLVLSTPPHPEGNHFALTLPGLGRPAKAAQGHLPQHAAIDLDYDRTGALAVWKPEEGPEVRTWLPHVDLAVAAKLTAGSAEHGSFWEAAAGRGKLTLSARLDLRDLLRPAVQPGSVLDHTPPSEEVSLVLGSSASFRAQLGEGAWRQAERGPAGPWQTTLATGTVGKEPLPLTVEIARGQGEPVLEVSFQVKGDGVLRPLPLRRILVPWPGPRRGTATVAALPAQLKGGSWLRGRQVFFSDEATCARCHKVGGQGGAIGPDLSNLVHRDYDSVLRDIRDPNAAINPDHLSFAVELKSGKVLTGVPRSDGPDRLVLADGNAKETAIERKDVEAMAPSPLSIMPAGIDGTLGPDRMRDLLTFLLTQPLQPAPLEIKGAPPPRTRAEVEAVLKMAERPKGPLRKLRVLLSSGPKDHGPGEHDYPLWRRRWVNLLSLADNVSVDPIDGWPTEKHFEMADVIVFYSNNPGWTAEKGKQLDAFLARGGGVVYVHYAVDGHKDPDALAQRIGLAWKGGASRFRHGALEVTFDDKHPITRGLGKVKFVDESYWNLVGDAGKVTVLGSAPEDGKDRPLFWSRQEGKGRVFVSIMGHYTWTFDDPLFRVLLLRGMAWSAGEPADRLLDLAPIGARIADGK